MAEEEKRRLEKTVSALQARFGLRAVRRLGQELDDPHPRLPTGYSQLDNLLGGGLPRGRITEIAGVPTSGMATLALRTVARAQAQGEMAIYIDPQQTFDPYYAARCGVIMDQLILIHPYNERQAWALLEEFAAGDTGIVICDLPLRALTSAGLVQALAASLERLLAPLARSSATLICLLSLPPAAAPAIERDPAAALQSIPLPHYATVRLLISRERWLYRRRDVHGYRVRVHILKNKLRPAKTRSLPGVELNILFEEPDDEEDRPFTAENRRPS